MGDSGTGDAPPRVGADLAKAETVLSDTVGASSTQSPSSHVEDELAPGARIERYVVLKTLGRGGMGIVYAAFDRELDRRVALKLLHGDVRASYGSESAAQRLLREAQAMAKLSHPNVVAVYDVGTYGDGVFLAMELIDGATLRAWLEAERPTPRQIVAMYVQAGRGLEAAHAAGILHRDFKPENTAVDARGRARVLDFGLARIDQASAPVDRVALASMLESSSRPDRELTREGAIVGTPRYMAPEQLRGERAEAASDQFGFCVALYEALYGHHPFEGMFVRELLANIEAERVRAPAPAKRTRVPRLVRGALLRGLRAKPSDRFASMSDLLAALEAAIAAPRRQAAIGAAIVGAAILATAFAVRPARAPVCVGAEREIGATWGDAQAASLESAFRASGNAREVDVLGRVRPKLDEYAASWARMCTESCEATRVRGVQSDDALDLRTACLDQRRRELGATIALLAKADAKLVDNAVSMVHSLSDLGRCADVASLRSPYAQPHDPKERKTVDAIRGGLAEATALYHARKHAEVEASAGKVVADAQAIGNRPLVAAGELTLGLAQNARGKSEEARRTLLAAALEANGSRDDTTEAWAWVFLVRVAGYDLDHYDESELYAKLAGAAIDRAGGGDDLRADLVRHRAHALYARGKVDESLPLYREALALREKAFGRDSMEAAAIEGDLADIEVDRGEVRAGIAHYESALQTQVAVSGEGNPYTSVLLANLAEAQDELGDGEGAVKSARRALATVREGDTAHAALRLCLVRGLYAEGDTAAAMAEQGAMLAEVVATYGAEGGQTGAMYSRLASTLATRHSMADAEDYATRSIAVLATKNIEVVSLRSAREIRTLSLARSRRATDALAEAASEVSQEEKESGPSAGALLVPLLAIGEASLASNDPARAMAPLERAARIAEASEGYPVFHADVHLALARALVASHGDADRARSLADRAANEYEQARLADLAGDARAVRTPR